MFLVTSYAEYTNDFFMGYALSGVNISGENVGNVLKLSSGQR